MNVDLKFVKEALLEIDPDLEGNEEDSTYQTALVLMAALRCGPEVDALTRFTQLPREFVQQIHQRMVRADLWTELGVRCDHWFVENAICVVAFWVDVLVAEGNAIRWWAEDKGQYRYRVVSPK